MSKVRFPIYHVIWILAIIGLLLMKPMFRAINVPLVFIFLPFIVVGWAMVVYGALYWRAKSFIVVTESSVRQSANLLTPLAETDLGGDPFPPMTLQLVGGAAWKGVAVSDKDVLLVRKSAVERLGRKTLLVYSPTQPLPGELLLGLAPAEADQATRASHSGFVAKAGAGSMLHFSLLDSLHGIDSQKLRAEQAFIIDTIATPMAHTRVKIYQGPDYYIKKIRGLASAIRRETPREKFGGFFKSSADAEAAAAADKERVK